MSMAIKYDQEFKNSPIGKSLYKKWLRIHTYDCSPEFKQYETFCQWALETGFTGVETLMRKDRKGPFTKENCCWSIKPPSPAYGSDKHWCEQWNKLVNSIRKAYGMEPLKTEDNEDGES